MLNASKGDRGVEVEEERVEEVELGLSLGGGWGNGAEGYRGVVMAEGFCSLGSTGSTLSAGSSVSSSGGLDGEEGSGGDGRADDMARSANLPSQVVGWPPIRTCRRNNLHNLSRKSTAKSSIQEEISQSCSSSATKKGNGGNDVDRKAFYGGISNFVKVKMDGDPIGRKVDLNTHFSYGSLALALEAMFHKPTLSVHASSITDGMVSKPWGHSSEFILIYEDEDGDWMLVGDVPWGMFLRTARRLRIMKAIDASSVGEEEL